MVEDIYEHFHTWGAVAEGAAVLTSLALTLFVIVNGEQCARIIVRMELPGIQTGWTGLVAQLIQQLDKT